MSSKASSFEDKIENNSGCVKFIKKRQELGFLGFLKHYLTYPKAKEMLFWYLHMSSMGFNLLLDLV